ncbi:RNA N(6)-adenosine-methyltransferase METTL16 isoform X1 [Panulirus ornatus]|uniref:RNA N(6)-adenosine-methyltransferase METTL16 isoform X1 n=1 Tax=Panulirus ornatus TaxID=150431 RepID=UPI003A88AC75
MTTKAKSLPPKLNKFMHPRNPYRTPPSFKKLATKYPDFRAHCTYDLTGKVFLDFKSPKALRALTTCLLDQDFGLQVNIPDDRLVPTLPLRFNYLLWIEDLLTHAAHRDSKQTVIGADIGAGAACVYPLLGAKHFRWCMLATESDQLSYTSAQANVQNNNLQDSIIVKMVEKDSIFMGVLDQEEVQTQMMICRSREKQIEDNESLKSCGASNFHTLTSNSQNVDELKAELQKDKDFGLYLYDFTMCNPPFFCSEEEMDTMKKSRKDRGEPISAPTGVVHEKVTTGGEVSFISQMIKESQLLKAKIRIFTTLIGTKAHIKQIKKALDATSPSCSVLTEFCQGRTMRWGLAWTYDPSLQLGQVKSKKQIVTNKPLVLMMPRSLMTVYSVTAAWNMIKKWLHYLKVKVHVFKSTKYFVSANVKAFKPTWLHLRRKKREDKRKEADNRKGDTKLDENNSEKTERTQCDMIYREKAKAEKEISQEVENGGEEGKMKKLKVCVPDENFENTHGSSNAIPIQLTSTKCCNISAGPNDANSEALTEISESIVEEQKLEITQEKDKQQDLKKCKVERLECILRCNLQIKQSGGLISLEAVYLSGSHGKDGLNQLLQFMRNQLTKPVL